MRQSFSQEEHPSRSQENPHRRETVHLRRVWEIVHAALDVSYSQTISHGPEAVPVRGLQQIVRFPIVVERAQQSARGERPGGSNGMTFQAFLSN